MTKWTVCLAGALALTFVGCGSTNKREIKKTAIDTEDARLTGYLEGLQGESCAPLCTPLERNVDVVEEVVLDEAILRKNNGEACFDVIIRTTLGYDHRLDELNPSCMLDGATAAAVVSAETFSIYEYGEDPTASVPEGEAAKPYRVVVADMSEADLHARAGEATSARVFYSDSGYELTELRVVERKASLCCPGAGATTVQLTLNNGVEPATPADGSASPEPPAGIDFVWFIVE